MAGGEGASVSSSSRFKRAAYKVFFELPGNRFPLHTAAATGQNGVASNLIAFTKAKVNARDATDMTPLMWAAGHGHIEMVRLLLDSGARINARAKMVWTMPNGEKVDASACALSLAAYFGHIEVVKLLLSRGANLGLFDHFAEHLVARFLKIEIEDNKQKKSDIYRNWDSTRYGSYSTLFTSGYEPHFREIASLINCHQNKYLANFFAAGAVVSGVGAVASATAGALMTAKVLTLASITLSASIPLFGLAVALTLLTVFCAYKATQKHRDESTLEKSISRKPEFDEVPCSDQAPAVPRQAG